VYIGRYVCCVHIWYSFYARHGGAIIHMYIICKL